MIKTNNFIKKGKKAIQDDLRREFVLASKDPDFVKLCARLKLKDEILILRGTYRLPFLLGQEVTIDEYIYRKVLVP